MKYEKQYFENLVICKIGLIPVLRIFVCLGYIYDLMPFYEDTSHNDLVRQKVERATKMFSTPFYL